MGITRQPTDDELNGVKQDTVEWDADAHRVTQVTKEGLLVDDSNPLPTKNWEVGVPGTFTKMQENTKKFNITKGQLNKPTIQARIGNEHVESSREIQGVISSGNIVGQIFKASKDNITGLYLTLESDEAVLLDNFESYANSAALQIVWVATGNLALLETVIVKSGTQSMNVPMDNATDEWIMTIGSSDYTNFTGDFDFQQDTTFDVIGGQVSVFIGDGTNTKSSLLPINNVSEWQHFEINEAAMTEDGGGTTDITAITKVGFRIVDKKIGANAYIDNLTATPPPGQIEIKLWDMGTTIPISTTTSIDDGTQYTKLNKNQSSVLLDLRGGKRLYHLHDAFTAGANKNEPSVELLNINNYYLLELKYVDTDVDVYGPDTSFAINYYNNGYAFTTPDEATAITAIGEFSDIMFAIQSMQDIYIIEAAWRFDSAPNGGSDMYVFVEDTGMIVTDTVVDHEEQPPQSKEEDVSNRPMFMEDGGKLEFYYNDDFTDNVSNIIITMTYFYEPPDING